MDDKIREYQESVAAILARDYFPESENYTIRTGEVRKNNSVHMHSINILTSGQTVSPNFYVNNYIDSFTPEAAAQAIYELYQRQLSEQMDIESNNIERLYNWDYVKDFVCFKLINRQKNEAEMEEYPYKAITNDLMLVFFIQVSSDATALINNSMTKLWKIEGDPADTLLEYAKDNTERLHPISFRNMSEVIKEIAPIEMMDMIDDHASMPMWVLTNRDKVNGAGALLYRGGTQLQDCLEELKKEFPDTKGIFILPSSIHEVLIIPDSKALGIDENVLQQMVREVNSTTVAPSDFLSNNVLYFSSDAGLKELHITPKEIAR